MEAGACFSVLDRDIFLNLHLYALTETDYHANVRAPKPLCGHLPEAFGTNSMAPWGTFGPRLPSSKRLASTSRWVMDEENKIQMSKVVVWNGHSLIVTLLRKTQLLWYKVSDTESGVNLKQKRSRAHLSLSYLNMKMNTKLCNIPLLLSLASDFVIQMVNDRLTFSAWCIF